MKHLFCLLVSLVLFSCGDDDMQPNSNPGNEIAIYIVKEGQFQTHGAEAGSDINTLELESTPWVKSSDIELYDWSSHTFYLNTKKEKALYSGRHFIVVSSDEHLFLGVFSPFTCLHFRKYPLFCPWKSLFPPAISLNSGS